MRRVLIPVVFVVLLTLATVLPVYAGQSDSLDHGAKTCDNI
jgi:hypothetical protein